MQNEGSPCRRERASSHTPGRGKKKDEEVMILRHRSELGPVPPLRGQGIIQATAAVLNLFKKNQNALGKTTVNLFTDTFDSLIVIIISAFIWLHEALRNLSQQTSTPSLLCLQILGTGGSFQEPEESHYPLAGPVFHQIPQSPLVTFSAGIC